jgi:serine/threonine protein phosphatase PrpC
MRVPTDCFGLTDRGRVRGHNEDQFLIADLDRSMLVRQTSLDTDDHTRLTGGPWGHLFVVADGVGGAAGGRRASGLAVKSLTRYVLHTMPWFFRLRPDGEDDLGDELTAALEACRDAVAAAAAEPGLAQMGTTLTLAYVLWPRLYVVHAGDSRAYLARGGKLFPLTRDHTVAQAMADRGTLTQEEADRSRWSRVLTKCVSAAEDRVAPDVHKAKLRPGDTLMLCSDGLSKYVSDETIVGLLADGKAEDAARRLVDAANNAGGEDNVTVVVARFPEDAS